MVTRSVQERMETPVGVGYNPGGPSLMDRTTLWDKHRGPINEYQALMEAGFLEEPRQVADATIWGTVADTLTPKEMAVINFRVVGGMSLRVAGQYLGAEFPRKGVPLPFSKMAVSNIQKRALAKLRQRFTEETNVTD